MDFFTDILSLNIETSTTLCSVSLGKNDVCIDCIESDSGEYQSEKLHLFIQEIFQKNGLLPQQLSVVSVSSGPGSYTGLRIGCATAKTMAYVLNVPLITVSSLQTQAFAYLSQYKSAHSYIASTMQARGRKIYLAVYCNSGKEILPPQAFILTNENLEKLVDKYNNDIIFVGSGAHSVAMYSVCTNLHVSSRYMVKEIYRRYKNKDFSHIVDFEPMYI